MAVVGFIGAGVMAEGILSGMLRGGFSPDEVMGADPDASRRAFLAEKYGIATVEDNQELASRSDLLVFAVKPQYFEKALLQVRPALRPGHKVISIMAGVTIARLEKDLRRDESDFPTLSVVRVMPNVSVKVQAGVTSLSAGSMASPEDVERARRLFGTVGSVVEIEERLMDAATGLAGCGPAYVALIIEALADGGVLAGLSRKQAQILAAETVMGAAKMVLADVEHPAKLKDDVCSAGGATIEGVYALERHGLRAALIEAVKAGADKCSRIT